MLQRFQSTHPARGATISVFDFSAVQNVFQSTHPARGATGTTSARAGEGKISIHAPREGCDLSQAAEMAEPEDFNPRTPRGVRLDMYNFNTIFHGFQSTHPARGATPAQRLQQQGSRISIHAPREGCDCKHRLQISHVSNFNPRTPRGVRPWTMCVVRTLSRFQSTHPARGATSRLLTVRRCRRDFNPRTPRGVRPPPPLCAICRRSFQSTHPARGATRRVLHLLRLRHVISIHAPREGCDWTRTCWI